MISELVLCVVEEKDPGFWRAQAQATLQSALSRKLNTNVAKNIVLFLGDGMGITTITAARILKGQLENQTGEETVMTMDTFPYVGLAKVYSVDFQIPDSAATATAYLCGVKTNLNVVGLSAAARNGVCRTQKGNESVGVVTTTRVQHATPAGAYAHSSRTWYSDDDMPASAKRDGCTDIAAQLINNTDIDVIIGGGRKYMTPKGTVDPEYPLDLSSLGKRQDNRNLIDEWISMKKEKVAHYIWNKKDFDAVDPETTDYLMALFEPGDLRYEEERDPLMDPSIIETTEKANRILQKNPKGFFLLVEGGRIDQGHHASRASMALHEAVALDNAVARALELTSEDETLTIVTADHSHSLSFNGYPFRGNSILGKSPLYGQDLLPYTTLMYGNGPGHKIIDNKRPDIRSVDTSKTTTLAPLKAICCPNEARFAAGVAEQFAIAEAKLRAWSSVDGDESNDDSYDEDFLPANEPTTQSTDLSSYPHYLRDLLHHPSVSEPTPAETRAMRGRERRGL
ncbi:hypothetical protein AOLI_G00325520 [Acnodon oligacanthus]